MSGNDQTTHTGTAQTFVPEQPSSGNPTDSTTSQRTEALRTGSHGTARPAPSVTTSLDVTAFLAQSQATSTDNGNGGVRAVVTDLRGENAISETPAARVPEEPVVLQPEGVVTPTPATGLHQSAHPGVAAQGPAAIADAAPHVSRRDACVTTSESVIIRLSNVPLTKSLTSLRQDYPQIPFVTQCEWIVLRDGAERGWTPEEEVLYNGTYLSEEEEGDVFIPPVDEAVVREHQGRGEHLVLMRPYLLFPCGPHRGTAYVEVLLRPGEDPLTLVTRMGQLSRSNTRTRNITAEVSKPEDRLQALLNFRLYMREERPHGCMLRLRGLNYTMTAEDTRAWVLNQGGLAPEQLLSVDVMRKPNSQENSGDAFLTVDNLDTQAKLRARLHKAVFSGGTTPTRHRRYAEAMLTTAADRNVIEAKLREPKPGQGAARPQNAAGVASLPAGPHQGQQQTPPQFNAFLTSNTYANPVYPSGATFVYTSSSGHPAAGPGGAVTPLSTAAFPPIPVQAQPQTNPPSPQSQPVYYIHTQAPPSQQTQRLVVQGADGQLHQWVPSPTAPYVRFSVDPQAASAMPQQMFQAPAGYFSSVPVTPSAQAQSPHPSSSVYSGPVWVTPSQQQQSQPFVAPHQVMHSVVTTPTNAPPPAQVPLPPQERRRIFVTGLTDQEITRLNVCGILRLPRNTPLPPLFYGYERTNEATASSRRIVLYLDAPALSDDSFMGQPRSMRLSSISSPVAREGTVTAWYMNGPIPDHTIRLDL